MNSRIWEMDFGDEIPDSIYQYRVMSTKHLRELRNDFDTLDARGKVSKNSVFRSYIEQQRPHYLPESFANAKSVVVMAVFVPLMKVDFHHQGATHEILVPHYYNDGITENQLENTILNRIIGSQQYRVENAKMHVLLKRLAVRTGLGKYGRNNLCYVDRMGSFLRLFAFFTDFEFEEDNWKEIEVIDYCDGCTLCLSQCPTGGISEDSFVINVERCLPLYNEVQGEFPTWIKSDSHNALMGCMRCQLLCPANREVAEMTQKLDPVSEQETKKILDGCPDDELIHSLSEKLRLFTPESASYYFPVISRNLRVLLQK